MPNKKNKSLTRKVVFTIFIIIVLRIGNYIPVANIDQRYLINIVNSNPSLKIFFNTKDLILSIFSLGIIPSINASILIQILTTIIPYLQKLQKEEGESGRRKVKQYTRILTLSLAIFQSLSITFALKPILFNWNFDVCSEITLTLTTGAMIVLWLSDLITEMGIGNGSSIILALNIISILPNTLNTILQEATLLSLAYSILSFTILIVGIIYLQEAVKRIPLVTSKQLLVSKNKRSNQMNRVSYLPLRINQVGVMPIIFSSTFIGFLTIFVNYVLNALNLINVFNSPELLRLSYSLLNFVLIVIFSFFYSNLILDPTDMAKELNKMGVTIENVRPGQQTASFLKKTLNRLTIIGSFFLGILGTFPSIGNTYGFGITSLIILVGVIIETTRQFQK